MRFTKIGSEWYGLLFFGLITFLFAAIVVNTIVAKINASYN